MTTDRAFLLHYARVLIAQARHFRQRGQGIAFPLTLLQWAANARRRAKPAQPDLFASKH